MNISKMGSCILNLIGRLKYKETTIYLNRVKERYLTHVDSSLHLKRPCGFPHLPAALSTTTAGVCKVLSKYLNRCWHLCAFFPFYQEQTWGKPVDHTMHHIR